MCILIAIFFIALFIYFVGERVETLFLVEKMGDANVTIAYGWGMVIEVWPLAVLFVLVGILLVMLFFKVKEMMAGKKVNKDDLVSGGS